MKVLDESFNGTADFEVHPAIKKTSKKSQTGGFFSGNDSMLSVVYSRQNVWSRFFKSGNIPPQEHS